MGGGYSGTVRSAHGDRTFGELSRFIHHLIAQLFIEVQAIGPAGAFNDTLPFGLRRQRRDLDRLGKRFPAGERPKVKSAFAVQGQQQAQRRAAIDFLNPGRKRRR